jgi:hypothetical protein
MLPSMGERVTDADMNQSLSGSYRKVDSDLMRSLMLSKILVGTLHVLTQINVDDGLGMCHI